MADRRLVVRIVGDSSSLQRSFASSSRATKNFDRDFSRATRGVLAGSGVFRSLGRSLAFASGGFLAFGGAAAFLRKSVDAAKEAQVANRQLAIQLQNSGKSLSVYRREIDRTTLRLSALAGVQDDELKAGLTTILRTVPNVGKALRDLGTATDLARARHISLGQAAIIIAKTEAGNTTLLRRQGFQIQKNATAEQALAKVRAVVAGQAKAGTTEQERFGAVLHDTEQIIGLGILPTLNKYLISGTKWLQQMNQSGRLQRDVEVAARDFGKAMSTLANIVKTVNRATGGFKNTLEILAAVKIATSVTRIADNVGLIGVSARTSQERVLALRGALLKLGAIGVITVAIEVLLNKGKIQSTVDNFLKKNLGGFATGKNIELPAGVTAKQIRAAVKQLEAAGADPLVIKALQRTAEKMAAQFAKAAADSDAKIASSRAGGIGRRNTAGAVLERAASPAAVRQKITAEQRNTFFDNKISRILLRTGLGNIKEQIAGLKQADMLIGERLKITKDVTRRLSLEDELLQNTAEIRSLQAQQTAAKLQAAQDARQKALDALQRAASARNARQFRALGFTGTGENVAPGVARLRNELGTLEQGIKGTFLDTKKTESVFSRIRKVLSGQLGAVGRDVRVKVQEILAGFDKQLKDHQTTSTKFAHANTNAVLAGLGLSPDQVRKLRELISQIGSGGTVPGSQSLAFSGAGTTVVHTTVELDGRQVAKSVTKHQQKNARTRTSSRRG